MPSLEKIVLRHPRSDPNIGQAADPTYAGWSALLYWWIVGAKATDGP